MEKMHRTIAIAALFILVAGAYAADNEPNIEEPVVIETISDAFKHGKVKGLLRYGAQHRDSNYHVLQDAPGDVSNEKVQSYSAIGGYLGYETAPLHNISLGATFYTSNPFLGSNADDRKGLGGLYEADGGQDSYHVLGEAFIKYQNDEHRVVVGRQEMPDYRFISLSNIRFTPFTHEGATYENTSIEGLKLNVAYITGQKDRNGIEFQDMVRSARVKTGCGAVDVSGQCIDTGSKQTIRGDYDSSNFDAFGNYDGEDKEMPMIGAIYSQNNFTAEAWNYYVNDFVNTLYLYGKYSFNASKDWKLALATQYSNQQDVGSSVAGNVDTWFYGLKAEATSSNGMHFFLNYNEVSYNENSYDGGSMFVRWGTPQMFNSFQVQDSELAGTKSVGVGAQFDLGALGILDSTVIRFRYADYNLPDDLSMIDARQDRTEATFDLRYSFTKTSGFGIFTQMDGLSIQFRIAYDNFKNDYDYVGYKAIHGYDFNSVTDNFVDARIYIDYVF
ncbi:MAG: porin [Epsilonproteobacteria bacterium]|nr:MAG: porin [Campylobacterota bacterium]